jgi:hypothetical protein
MKSLIYISLSLFLLLSCNKGEPTITLNIQNGDSLLADGTSTLELTAQLGWEPTYVDQTVTFSTSSGKLFSYPIISLNDSAGASQKIVSEENQMAKVVLLPGTQVLDAVFIHVKVNRITDSRTIKFVRACPDTILLGGSEIEKILFLSQGTKINLPIDLRREHGKVSDKTTLELSVEPMEGDTIQVSYESVLEAGNNPITTPIQMKSNSKIGKFDFHVMVKQPGCPSIRTTQEFEVKE